ncbi:energy-coupling factor transport system ATP-binding protein [Ruminiclostridium sufflavum DSM 19573]|uniref:Energy-coupling factor transport system ATP-binding protein n=1 Tax=Ruminiclostridium sufflavum DSM 19573 TaxID=1121337 RepID=A0A318XIE1_9FIRM|nr:energy-coupling factor transporter ATPase [Ruminiclostridium sufflavum]PYG85681.1 energy-coupling factor transport system ATP-binding protein [Ruminiclostridium sufflavum DSM 19573]
MNSNIFDVSDVNFLYAAYDNNSQDVHALKDINIKIQKGDFVVILGRNGSGKSTLSRLLNALLIPQTGKVLVMGMDTADENNTWSIRSTAGMVFQNPDNQIIATTVEEDVAFGPENLGVEPGEIRKRVDDALATVGISHLKENAPHLLSGGQKQRVAIAGILAMKPQCIILDEATSMLDPVGRKEVMSILRKLNEEESITIVHITHHMDEAALAKRLIIVDNGKIVLDGKPREVFSKVSILKSFGLDVPQVTDLFYSLKQQGIDIKKLPLTVEEAFEIIDDLQKHTS